MGQPLGSKKLKNRWVSHYINRGVLLLDEYRILKAKYAMHFPTRLCGAVDSVISSHSDLISRCAVMVFESWYNCFLFNFLYCYVIVSRTFFSLHILLWNAERMSDRKAIRPEARQIAANVLKVCE